MNNSDDIYDARAEREMERQDMLRDERRDREWEREFADAVEETNSPSAKLIERLERELAEALEQRDRLAEVIEFVLEDSELTNGHFWPDVVARCRAALAAVKGGKP